MATTILPIDEVTEALIAQWGVIGELARTLDDDAWSAPSVLPGWTNAEGQSVHAREIEETIGRCGW